MEEENEVFRPLFIENLKRYKDENIIKNQQNRAKEWIGWT